MKKIALYIVIATAIAGCKKENQSLEDVLFIDKQPGFKTEWEYNNNGNSITYLFNIGNTGMNYFKYGHAKRPYPIHSVNCGSDIEYGFRCDINSKGNMISFSSIDILWNRFLCFPEGLSNDEKFDFEKKTFDAIGMFYTVTFNTSQQRQAATPHGYEMKVLSFSEDKIIYNDLQFGKITLKRIDKR